MQNFPGAVLRIVCCPILVGIGQLANMSADEIQVRFSSRIRKLRELAGLSQEALAVKAGLHRTHVSLIETGKRSVRLETIGQLASALGVPISGLFPSSESNDRATGDLFVADLGYLGADEINRFAANAGNPNFGWNRQRSSPRSRHRLR